jgi:hypothetical protein
VGKPERKRPLGRPRLRWEEKIKKDLQEVEWVVWSGLMCLGPVVGCCECGNEPSVFIKCWEFLV